jgi:hypothetical protein
MLRIAGDINVVLILCYQRGDISSGNGHNTENLNEFKYLGTKDNFSDADIPGLFQKVFSVCVLCYNDGLFYDMGTFTIWVVRMLDAQLLLKCG